MTEVLMNTSIVDRLLGIDKALNWDKNNFSLDDINHFLLNPQDEYEFNNFPYPIESRHDLKKAIGIVKSSVTTKSVPWVKRHCSCGTTFVLSFETVQWYKNNGYQLPTICEGCIKRFMG